eukprot:CAMPEP_0179457196 /NCGR_PEP_ID=MMETSP0799-20121207/41039_1 /TAXON_ID=46947 /ORGANISM="Geminigera cryophila, Strain CCMP2564" /LENGTH=64 /DNA_ID=CAMNT_0021257791 /DNA_START=673 /DNA_END=867 /DNA_ORIENTATION=+
MPLKHRATQEIHNYGGKKVQKIRIYALQRRGRRASLKVAGRIKRAGTQHASAKNHQPAPPFAVV